MPNFSWEHKRVFNCYGKSLKFLSSVKFFCPAPLHLFADSCRFCYLCMAGKCPLDQYCITRNPLGVSSLWDYLADNPTLAREVRVLEIQRQMGGYKVGCLEPEVLERFHSAAEHVAGTGIPYSFFLSKYVPSLKHAEKALIAALRNIFYMKQRATIAEFSL